MGGIIRQEHMRRNDAAMSVTESIGVDVDEEGGEILFMERGKRKEDEITMGDVGVLNGEKGAESVRGTVRQEDRSGRSMDHLVVFEDAGGVGRQVATTVLDGVEDLLLGGWSVERDK